MEIGDCVLLMEGHTAAVTDCAVAEEGSLLVTSSADHTARVWGLDKGQCRAVLQGHTAAVNAVAVDARGRFAVTASADATGRVWDLHSGQCAHVLRGHGGGAAGAGAHLSLHGASHTAHAVSNVMSDSWHGQCNCLSAHELLAILFYVRTKVTR